MIETHYKRQLIALKRKLVVPIIMIITITSLTKSKQLPFLEYQKSDQKSKKNKIKHLDIEFQTSPNFKRILCKNKVNTK